MSESITEKQINLRFRLMQSASFAKRSGHSADAWKNDSQIKNAVLESGLSLNLLEHISAWVWTFNR